MTIDRISTELTGRYQSALSAITGIVARALDSHDPTTAKVRDDVRTQLSAEVSRFSQSMPAILHGYAEALMVPHAEALSAPDVDLLRSHIDGHVEDLAGALSLRLSIDANSAMRALKGVALNVDLASMAGASRVGALIKHKFGVLRKLRFSQADSIGRKSSSLSFASALIRKTMLLVSVESQLFAMARAGIDVVQVERDGAPVMRFSITGVSAGIPAYDEISQKTFHPNFVGNLTGVI